MNLFRLNLLARRNSLELTDCTYSSVCRSRSSSFVLTSSRPRHELLRSMRRQGRHVPLNYLTRFAEPEALIVHFNNQFKSITGAQISFPDNNAGIAEIISLAPHLLVTLTDSFDTHFLFFTTSNVNVLKLILLLTACTLCL